MPGKAPVRGRMANILQVGCVQVLGGPVNPARPHGVPRLWREARHTNTQKQLDSKLGVGWEWDRGCKRPEQGMVSAGLGQRDWEEEITSVDSRTGGTTFSPKAQ